MGRTAHSAGRSAAQTTRSTLPAPLSNATRYGSTPTIGEPRYAQPVKERPELRTTPDTQPSPHPTRATFCSGAPSRATETPTNEEFGSNAAIYWVHEKNRFYYKRSILAVIKIRILSFLKRFLHLFVQFKYLFHVAVKFISFLRNLIPTR